MSRFDLIRGATSIALAATVLVGCASGAGADGVQAPSESQTPSASQVVVMPEPSAAGGGALDPSDLADLCAIFPADRAAAALGEPVGPAKSQRSVTFGHASCRYESTASDASIAIWYHSDLTRADWEQSMAKVGMDTGISVADIGDAAYRRDWTAGLPRVKLAAFEGDHDVWVIIEKAGDVARLGATAQREARDLLALVL
jgi:hypothetical protein